MKCRILFDKFFPWRDGKEPPSEEMVSDFIKSLHGTTLRYGLIDVARVKSAKLRNSPKGKYVEFEIEPIDDVDNTRSVSPAAIRRIT